MTSRSPPGAARPGPERPLFRNEVRQLRNRGVKAGQWRIFFSDTAVLDKVTDHGVRRTVVVPKAKATA